MRGFLACALLAFLAMALGLALDLLHLAVELVHHHVDRGVQVFRIALGMQHIALDAQVDFGALALVLARALTGFDLRTARERRRTADSIGTAGRDVDDRPATTHVPTS